MRDIWSNDRLLVPLVRYLKAHGWAIRTVVVPVEENSTESAMDGVLALASKRDEVSESFEQFCRENLCLESWYFTVDAVLYQRVSWPFSYSQS